MTPGLHRPSVTVVIDGPVHNVQEGLLPVAMALIINMTTLLLPLLYGVAAVNYVVAFVRDAAFATRTRTPMLTAVVVVHLVYVVLRIVHFHRQPVVSLAEALTMIALSMAVIYLYVERIQSSQNTGAFFVPVVAALQLASAMVMPPHFNPPSELLAGTLFGVHTVSAILGYTAFFVGAVYGMMYVLLFRALKRQTFGSVYQRLPSLDVLTGMSFWAMLLGWVCLTITLACGVLMARNHFPGFHGDPKVLMTVAVWVIYGAGISAYIGLGWRGSRAVYISLVGFAFALISLLGNMFSEFHVFET